MTVFDSCLKFDVNTESIVQKNKTKQKENVQKRSRKNLLATKVELLWCVQTYKVYV